MISFLGIVDKIEEFMNPVRTWIFEHNNNPIFWLMLFVVVLSLFLFATSVLNKDN